MYRSIQFLFQNKGVTITQMSRETNIPRSVFLELKSGRTKQLSSKYLHTLSEYFGAAIDYLLGNTEQKEKAPRQWSRGADWVSGRAEKPPGDENSKWNILSNKCSWNIPFSSRFIPIFNIDKHKKLFLYKISVL